MNTSYGPVMSFADDRELRKQMYFAQNTKAASGAQDNTKIIQDVLALRREKAKLLGFGHFADLAIDGLMQNAAMAYVAARALGLCQR